MAAGTAPVSIGMGKPAITGAEVDAVALRRVAMTGDVVRANDNFTAISSSAVRDGRAVYDNLKRGVDRQSRRAAGDCPVHRPATGLHPRAAASGRLRAEERLKVLGTGLLVFGMAELEKLVIRRRGRAIRAWGR